MGKLVLVTGADGFVGRHLVQTLLDEGYSVRAVDLSFRPGFPKNTERIECDILDMPMIVTAMAGVDIVFHLAAYTGLWAPNPTSYQAVNVEGTHCVLKSALEANVPRFVHCSSFVTVIAGSTHDEREVDETENPDPSELFGEYAVSKWKAERLVRNAAKAGKIEAVTVMPSAPLGSGDYNMTAPTRLLRDLINGKIPATLNQVINFVDVTLLARTMIVAAQKGRSGERYLIVGCNLTMADFLKRVEALSGVRMPRSEVPYWLAAFVSFFEEKIISRFTKRPPKAPYAGVRMAGRKRYFSVVKAQRELDFMLIPLDHAIRASLEWLRDEGEIKRKMPKL